MEDYKRTIKELMARRDRNEKTMEEQMRQLGKHLAELEPSKVDKTSLANLHQQARDLAATSARDRKRIAQIDGLASQVEEVNSELKKNGTEIRKTKKGAKSHYEELGFAAYETSRKNSKQGAAYGELFSRADSQEKELSRIEVELGSLQDKKKSKSPIGRAYGRGRLLYLRGLLKVKRYSQSAVYSEIGERAFGSDSLAEFSDNLAGSAKPVIDAQETLHQLLKEEQSLLAKKKKLTEQIARLDGRPDAVRPARDIEIHIGKAERELAELYYAIGGIYINDSLNKEIPSDKAIEGVFRSIRALGDENRSIGRQMRKLEAALAIAGIDDKITGVGNRVDQLKDSIAKTKDEISSLTQRLAELEGEKKEQMKIRDSGDPPVAQRPIENSDA